MLKIRHIDVGNGIENLEEWMSEDLHQLVDGGEIISSNPPVGFVPVVNIYLKEIDKEVILITGG